MRSSEISDSNDDEAGLITPEQIKLFVDRMIVNSRFNDEYVAAAGNWGPDGPITRWLMQLELLTRQCRQNLVSNNVSSVLNEMKELAAQVNFPIEPGSKNEHLVGRAMLRAEADYYEETFDRECKERGLSEYQNLRSLSTDVLRAALAEAWQKERSDHGTGSSAPLPQFTNLTKVPTEKKAAKRRTKKGSVSVAIGKRRGRAPVYNWPAAQAFVEDQLEKNGHWEVSPVDGWRSKTDLAKRVITFLEVEGAEGPSLNTVMETINPWIDKWLSRNPSGL